MIHAELHDGINRFWRANTFHYAENRLINHWAQDTIADKSGVISSFYRGFAKTACKFDGSFKRCSASGVAPDDLDQRHQRHGIHEVHADHLFRSARGCTNLSD